MIVVLLMLTLGQTSTASNPVREYLECAKTDAEELEASGETALVIADVAVSRCESKIENAYVDAIGRFKNQPEVATAEATGKPYLNYGEHKPEVMQQLREGARKVAIRAIIEKRAKKAKQ